ncbi:oligosaccharide flippase family protein [Epilithonimonas xixisoli]|uniref:O-antigen/teichoic acid export membrane protein n=1 Tax=Epilithonimonas xixisoli TaxID=1476462 RepID=A0A4R8I5J8_9FLAO|nr:oligosaccharide flippase family protein [Epilithonimonas xixisoli]TDX83016.1 O-antigen/teichoic acid export membrane protein [Epilithonimonas xixisoli]
MISIVKKNLKSNFFRDSFWALIGNVIFRGSGLIASILLAKILQKNAYGEFNSLKNTLTTLAIFTTFGLGYTSTKFVADCISDSDKNPKKIIAKIYKIALGFSVLVGLLTFLFAPQISELYYNNSAFDLKIRILSIWIVLLAVSTAQNGVIAGLGIFKKFTYVNISIGITTLILIPLFAYYYDIIGACISLLIIQAVNCIVNEYFIRNNMKAYTNLELDEVSYTNIISYSLPLTLIEAIYSISLWVNYFLLQNNYDYGEVALYSTSMQWYILLLFIPMVLKNVLLSYFSKKNLEQNVFKNAIILSFISTFFPVVFIFIFSSFIEQMYGNNFVGLSEIIRLMSIIPIFSSIVSVMEQYLFSKSKNWIVFIISFLKDIGTCALFFYFIQYENIENAAYYLILSYLILNTVSFIIYALLFFKTGIHKKSVEIV